MARKADGNVVEADMRPADYRGAVQRIRTITAKKDKISGVNGEIADIWAKIEGLKVNKKAGKIFLMLDQLEAPDRLDIMRSLNGLCDASGWDEAESDLVDQARGEVVHMRFGAKSQRGNDQDEEGEQGGEDSFEASEAELAKQKDRTDLKDKKAATPGTRRKARPAAAKSGMKDNPAPYTGDNTDLAGEGGPTVQ